MDLSNYQLPESLKKYLEDSKTIKSKLSDEILGNVEDVYLRLYNFYDFNEEAFGEVAVDCLNRYKAEETFNYFLFKNVKDTVDLRLKREHDEFDDMIMHSSISAQQEIESILINKLEFERELEKGNLYFDKLYSIFFSIGYCESIFHLLKIADSPLEYHEEKYSKINVEEIKRELHYKHNKFIADFAREEVEEYIFNKETEE